MGLGQKVHREQLDSGLPEELARQFHAISEWAHTIPERFGASIAIRLVDVASIEGFFKSLIHRLGRYPAFLVDGKRYVGSDFSQVDSLIAERIGAQEAQRRGGARMEPDRRGAPNGERPVMHSTEKKEDGG